MDKSAKKKKPLNRQRRMKEMLRSEPKKERSPLPPSGFSHKTKKDKSRQKDKSNLKKKYVGFDSSKVAEELLAIAKDGTGLNI